MLRSFVIPSLMTVLVGCGGETEADAFDPGSGGSSAMGGAAGAPSGGGAAGAPSGGGAAGAATGGAGGAECVLKGEGWPSGTEPTCADLSVLSIDTPVVTDGGGDGSVSAGEAFDLKVVLREVAGVGFGWYPGVKFESDHPGVSLSGTDWFYGIFGCSSYEVAAQGKVDASVKSGTVIELRARAAMLNEECPSAPSLTLKLTVK